MSRTTQQLSADGNYEAGDGSGLARCYCSGRSYDRSTPTVAQGEDARPEDTARPASAALQRWPTKESGQQTIARALRVEAQEDKEVLRMMLRLKKSCIFCTVVFGHDGPSISRTTHTTFNNCDKAMRSQCQLGGLLGWRASIILEGLKHCYKCGLAQDLCRFVEGEVPWEFPQVMFLGLFVLHKQGTMAAVVDLVGFRGNYEKDLLDWMKREEQGEHLKWESNLMRVWRQVCHTLNRAERSGRGYS